MGSRCAAEETYFELAWAESANLRICGHIFAAITAAVVARSANRGRKYF